jgi:hypothetical protein
MKATSEVSRRVVLSRKGCCRCHEEGEARVEGVPPTSMINAPASNHRYIEHVLGTYTSNTKSVGRVRRGRAEGDGSGGEGGAESFLAIGQGYVRQKHHGG